MRQSKSTRLVRNEENYIFYTCLILVLAIAAAGILTDIVSR
jgi:hypothetical protein